MRLSPNISLLASTIAVSLLVMGTNAASSSDLPNIAATQQTTQSAAAAATAAAVTSASGSATPVASGSASQTTGSSKAAGFTITGSGVVGSATGAVSITGGGSATNGGGLPPGLPTLTGAFVIVAPTVPSTADAPFMKTSNLPEGTVFIVVGAILGFMAMSVLLWRGLVAWSHHRSVKRAAEIQNMADSKAHFGKPGAPPAPFYKYSDRDSTLSLSGLGPKGGKKHGRPSTGGAIPSNLFFSPTAGAAGAGLATPGNRGSNYLPAGYYASGAAAPAGGAGHVPIGHGPSISMSNLNPGSNGYSRARSMGTSPPDSPAFTPERHSRYMASSSTLNLNGSYNGLERAPSAYLEDLMDGNENSPLPKPPGSRGGLSAGSGLTGGSGGGNSHSRNNSGTPLRERN